MYWMSRSVKRPYDASGRQAAARQNRARVLEVAGRRFAADGYAATTLASIAGEAGVSVETINKAFRNKAGLLKALFDVAVAGDDEPVAIEQRDFVAAIRAEPDGRRKLQMYAEHLTDAMPRAAPVQLLIRSAAAVDADLAAVWDNLEQERLTGMGMFAADLAGSGVLRDDVDRDEARDVLWTYTGVEVYDLLVVQRGWSLDRYARFIADGAATALLPTRS
jgi:AcrR family transcriptional regulator